MKTFSSLSRSELLALTADEARRYVDLACAQAGIPLLPPEPGPKPEPLGPQSDVIGWQVGDLIFLNQSEANELAKDLNGESSRVTTTYNYPRYQDKIVATQRDPVQVVRVDLYSAERAFDTLATREAWERRKDAWERTRKEWEAAVAGRQEHQDAVDEAIRAAQVHLDRTERFARELQRYVDLADGQHGVGRRFLLKAHPEAEAYLEPEVADFLA